MNKFSECYKKAMPVAKDLSFFSDYSGALEVGNLGIVMGADGPKREHAGRLTNLRIAILLERLATNRSVGDIIVDAAEKAGAAGVVSWVKSLFTTYSLEERAATLKMLAHLYLRHAKGAQDVWIYSPPVKYKKWVYDEVAGLSKAKLKTKLTEEEEVYSATDFGVMGESTTMALAWSMKVGTKLASPDAATKDLVKFWFLPSGASDDDVTSACKTLQAGFTKITRVLNSNKLVLSDEPVDRNGGGWKDYAFIFKSEKMNVIYIQNATLKSGKSGHMWLAALTIVHELSHREVDTDDHRYDSDGKLSPQATGGLASDKALDNADNWGYFAADLNGMLMPGKKKSVSGVP